MPPVGFEPTISAGERPKTYALDRAATGTGTEWNHTLLFPYANASSSGMLLRRVYSRKSVE